MTIRRIQGLAVLAALAVAGAAVHAEGHADATQALATITMNLDHRPSDADKQQLAAIAAGDGAAAAIAAAMLKLEHRLGESDKEELGAIAADESVTPELREIAGILVGINHRPSEEEKATLAKIAGSD